MQARILFSGPPEIYDFVEQQRDKLKKAYEGLSDNQALDEAFLQEFKKKFMLDVPRLRPAEWTSEQKQITPHSIEIVAYIPFDGDPAAFKIRPSAFKMTHAQGEIVDHELLIRVQPIVPKFDTPGYVKTQLDEVQWRLDSLRGSMEHMSQQLEIQIRECMQARRRSIAHLAEISQNVGIPQRKVPVAAAKPESAPAPKPAVMKPKTEKPVEQTWDIFMSHAWPDKPYVRGLVQELKKAGVTVWFDDDSVGWGDSLRQGMKKGILNCRFGIIVLSKAYLAERKWTEHELDGLMAREKLGESVILPIWHGVGLEDIEHYDAPLSLRKAKISATDGYADIVAGVLQKLGR